LCKVVVPGGHPGVLKSALPGRVGKSGITLTPTDLTLNPDLVFDGGEVVGDVKYKLETSGRPEVPVGDVGVQHFAWDSDPDVNPGEAAALLSHAVETWLDN
jgi:hypothetical protein